MTAMIEFPAEAFAPDGTNPPGRSSLTKESLSNAPVRCLLYDDTTEEIGHGSFEVPSTIASGTVTFRLHVYALTPAASKNVAATFSHKAVAHGEDASTLSYTDEDSGDVAVQYGAGENRLTVVEWTETVANLGWVAKDEVFFKVSMPQATANNLTDDRAATLFTIEIPTS